MNNLAPFVVTMRATDDSQINSSARPVQKPLRASRGYIINPMVTGTPLTETAQVRMAGNSVCPVMAEALVRAIVLEQQQGGVA